MDIYFMIKKIIFMIGLVLLDKNPFLQITVISLSTIIPIRELISSNKYKKRTLYVKKLLLECCNIMVYFILFVYAYHNESKQKAISQESFYYSGYIVIALNLTCLITYSIIDIYLNLSKFTFFKNIFRINKSQVHTLKIDALQFNRNRAEN